MISNSSTRQDAFFLDEPENTRRGKSAIIWTIISLVFTILAWISIEVLIQFFKNYTKGSITHTESFASCISAFFIAFSFIVILVYIYKFSVWIYHAVKEQNKYTTTKLTPLKAVLLGSVLGPIIDAYIFKDLFRKQNATLEEFGLKPTVLPELGHRNPSNSHTFHDLIPSWKNRLDSINRLDLRSIHKGYASYHSKRMPARTQAIRRHGEPQSRRDPRRE